MKEVVAGIDIGGTNTVIGILDRAGNTLGEETISTRDFPDALEYAQALCAKIRMLLGFLQEEVELKGVGIGAPNGNFYSGSIEQAPNLLWKGTVPLARWIEAEMQVPCVLTNDANAAALGEMLFGAARGMKHFVLITIGTGLGSGIVVDGKLIYGHDGFAGEIGHALVRPGGRICTCGRRGCLETYVSARGIRETLGEMLIESSQESQLATIPLRELTVKDIHQAADRGDQVAIRTLAETGNILGEKLADSVNYTSPEAFIITGGIAHAGELLFGPCRASLEHHLLNIYRGKVKLMASELIERNAGLMGAAALIWEELAKVNL
ncbi:MAG: ROK family protein [Bacteroidia bacterium]|nr:ROK family protein [Bacteroidia bacterium]